MSARASRWLASACLALVALLLAPSPAAQNIAAVPRMEFVPPAPGSYTLPPIQRVPDGVVLDVDRAPRPLSRYTSGRITLLSFVYTYCIDATGCPLAYDTFVKVRERLLATPQIARHVRLVSLSFDPTHDTPTAMRAYGGRYLQEEAGLRWSFLTTRSVAALLPLLEGFGQDVEVERDARGKPTRTINHMLKAFLIDRHGRVREIYSAEFMLPAVIENDIRTLLMEEGLDIAH